MAEQANQRNPNDEALWRRFLTPKWIAILVVVSIVIHGIGFACVRLASNSPPVVSRPEVSLGVFRFEAGESEVSRVAAAEFALHIALLEQVDQAARRRLEAYQFRVQQDVEELLRRAHGGDFEDPSLGELKRQLQERINETLGMRVIADVIITDLKIQRHDRNLGVATDTAEAVPWVEKPSG
jgi:flagellar basal body-associated protein FliL